ncbi:hypothetical protein GQ53DRAFT_759603 [Thozetella sp. PMI_491]|nr:hypothetical protein GQ53DRAFT_759603 [Thozetella sp. PMI_491]
MADSLVDEALEDAPENVGDVEMAEEAGEGAEGTESAANEAGENRNPAVESIEDSVAPRTAFAQYLTSPVVNLMIGSGDNETVLTAHQALLARSPYFAEIFATEVDDGSPRTIDLSSDDFEAVGSFLEFLYTGDYFPKKIPGQRTLETDPSIPEVDESGEQLLKHARVYTLAERFQLPHLKNLASSKIHCVSSTAKGEIAYARYVYEFTSKEDKTIRSPVASFWASRSHTLRAEAEEEFRSLCLEFPEFGYDVLTRVLDEKLKRERNEKSHPAPGSARKRARHANT